MKKYSFQAISCCLLLLFVLVLGNMKLHAQQVVEQRINSLVSQMTLEEKIQQLHKDGGMTTARNNRLNIPGFVMADGPHGVRDGMATSFPVGIGIVSSWDVELAERVGIALGKEFRAKGKHQMLGPAIDLTRDPRNGRTPESGGEDPYLNALINSALTIGAQSTGTIATAKHYNGKHKQIGRNDNEYRLTQRLLREQYGFNFRTLVQDADVLSVMSAYNKIKIGNAAGEQSAEHSVLLQSILRTSWGFPYYVVSDWGAVHNTQKAIQAGTDICMGSDHYQNDLLSLVTNGTVSESVINTAVKNVLRTKILSGILDYLPAGDPSDLNSVEHQLLCLESGKKGLVLLKNQNNILPLNKNTVKKIAVIGPNAAEMKTDGSGSSWVDPFYKVSPLQGIEKYVGADKILYAQGCTIGGEYSTDQNLAISYASTADVVIFFGGLDQTQEGEGFDRANGSVQLPGKQKELIQLISKVNPNIILVLISGGVCTTSPIENDIKGLIQAFYPGQEGGNAIAQVIFGDYNPSGKLPVTIPKDDSQLGTEITDFDFSNDEQCGYRWFDKQKYIPQYAFGFGLSYTTFEYSNITITPAISFEGQLIEISCDLKNTGNVAGEEVAQLYITESPSYVPKPLKELKGFKKVYLEPGETKRITFSLTPNELYYYNERTRTYRVDNGFYVARIGGSSDILPLKKDFEIRPAAPKPDLQIAAVKIMPAYPIIGDKVKFLATIINRGTGATPQGSFHEVKFSVNGNEICRSIEFSDSITAGGMALVSGNFAENEINYWNAESSGEFTVEAYVDDKNAFAELNELNNSKRKTFKVYSVPPTNLALNKNVTVSSIESNLYLGGNAVDGNEGSRWSSQFSDPQSIKIDFGSPTSFNEIRLTWESAYAKEYKIEISDDNSIWSTIFEQKNGYGGIEKISITATARYIKLTGLKRATQYGYSLYEIEVFNVPVTSVDKNEPELPYSFSLSNNYPNPFNPSTTINYSIPKSSVVKIEIFNSLGELVNTIVYKEHNAGSYTTVWNGRNSAGSMVSSGIYFYRLNAEGITLVKKMMMLK